MTNTVLLASSRAHPRAQPFDADLAERLTAVGIGAAYAPWDDPAVDWAAADAVILRSTWDYHERLPEFLAWTREVGRVTRLHNPAPLVAWNTHKGYLRGLERQGFPVVPTAWVARGDDRALADVMSERGWTDAVAKPCVSLGAVDTRKVRTPVGHADEAWWQALGERQDRIVQPFLPAIAQEGELSFLFFGGRFSHAVRKVPKRGDFRVQAWHGGSSQAYDAPAADVEAAEPFVHAVARPLYARVDMVRHDGRLHLMELELIEPNLFLDTVPSAADRFVAAVQDRLGR